MVTSIPMEILFSLVHSVVAGDKNQLGKHQYVDEATIPLASCGGYLFRIYHSILSILYHYPNVRRNSSCRDWKSNGLRMARSTSFTYHCAIKSNAIICMNKSFNRIAFKLLIPNKKAWHSNGRMASSQITTTSYIWIGKHFPRIFQFQINFQCFSSFLLLLFGTV